ncbi:hypothetical protein HJC23_001565 [Cyclotella cryptica]|uniref:Uncharacterized protein n=1 Tax=Cyclotella cryptica TaxID=29204 RepID=A0ABD3PWN8_9STRA|eukprot:CCRYP_010783-RA/>CCRYP_010783-RA protein AED:0.36 eAED:0.36 QI:0/-1/0/1/-1/1/1/0/342
MTKKASTKKAKQQQQQQQQQQKQQQSQRKAAAAAAAVTELSTFSLAAAIEEARASSHSSTASTEPPTQETQPRKIFNIPSSLRKKQTSQSHQSIATNSSYNTAHDSAQNTPAVSYFVDSSDEDNEQTASQDKATASITPTNSEIVFSSDPEVTMSIKTTKTTPVMAAPAPAPVVAPPATKPTPVVAPATKSTTTPAVEDPHFDVAQHIYTHAKDIWAWGKTLPLVTNLLHLTEAVATKLLEATLHTNLPAIDADVATPNLKKLDDQIVTPAILKVWSIVGPAVSRGEEMIVKPVMEEVVPKILDTVGMGGDDKKKKKESASTSSSKVDNSPNPEYTSAPMVN